ncbi:DUF1833 family protein [Coralloluteibacterium thermophilus]|uniref:DUF1833 family protein n=1 Tax=Coralloluteibacterium thermophilum TaxID=2707049 RepID=A0ABV9NNR1_9GAMM
MTFLECTQRVTDTGGVLVFLEIESPSFSGPMHIVSDTQDWVSNGRTYIGLPFGFRLPEDRAGSAPRAELVMSNVGRGITEELERLGPNETVMAKLMISHRRNPNLIARTFFLPLTAVSVNAGLATAQAGVDYLMRQQAVQLRGTPYTLPGLF